MMKIQINNPPKHFVLILYQIGSGYHKVINILKTKSQRHFARKLRLLNSQIECYLKVSYGSRDYNDGNYNNKHDLMVAYRAFCEK